MTSRSVVILGASGSIGESTLSVLGQHPERYSLLAVTAHSRWELLVPILEKFMPRYAVVADADSAQKLCEAVSAIGSQTRVLHGAKALEEVAGHPDADIVVAGIVGSAGLLPTLAAVRRGKHILLANKESLVMAGAIFMREARLSGARILPIDSEHNAIFQCLPEIVQRQVTAGGLPARGVRRVLLTASGGPFLHHEPGQLFAVTPDQACRHPRWDMGRKISVDSATLMNKGLELIEACWLFDLSASQVDVHIHPQSIVHSMVEYLDGSILAQLGSPDMRTPIAHALAWPERISSGVSALDLFATEDLQFYRPDRTRFRCLQLAEDAMDAGGMAPTLLNAANEVAVDAFLQNRIRFTDVPAVIEASLQDAASAGSPDDLEDVLEADRLVRLQAEACIATLQQRTDGP